MTDVVDGRAAGKDESIAEDSLTSASWQANGRRFVAGGTRGQFYQCVSIRLSPLCPSTLWQGEHAASSTSVSVSDCHRYVPVLDMHLTLIKKALLWRDRLCYCFKGENSSIKATHPTANTKSTLSLQK